MTDDLPLEALIEALSVPWRLGGRNHHADLRLMFGRRWRKLLHAAGLNGLVAPFQAAYPFTAPDPAQKVDYPVTAHSSAWQTLAAIAGRSIDGGALFLHLQGGGQASDGLGLAEPQLSNVDRLGREFRDWAAALFLQPDKSLQAWSPRHLEYGLSLSAPEGPNPARLAALEYRGGRLDWFHFDATPPADGDAPGQAQPLQVTSFMPTQAQFEGMPNTRHWAFEEGTTNFGDINPDTTDIAKLLLIEFGLLYANDWFLLPMDLPVGSLTRVEGLAVTNVFGERIWIEPAVDPAGPVQSWQMFRLTGKGRADGRLFLPPTTPTALESQPVETVHLIRDEVSNMAWGIETVVPVADGSSRHGREVALELRARHQASVVPPAQPPAAANEAKIRYSLMTEVAEHWIPFVPVHVPNDNREIQLQRAGMPRLLKEASGQQPDKIQPRTRLLRHGLDQDKPEPYFIAEEEVERAGTVIEAKWQRCRWYGGRVVIWLGQQRRVGRGQGHSGLGFDVIRPKATARKHP